ncbi:MAG: hypothetical protein P4L84_28875 [Isosphaeraceae bacterium]|nr:hypothetical protein [Isosphaeraceae bacterium]
MGYTVQIFHPESGFYLNTNHVADDLDELRRLIEGDAFSGVRLQIVDGDGMVRHGPIARARQAPLSIADIAGVLGVPVVDRFELPDDSDQPDA